jgi:hypothetical protein
MEAATSDESRSSLSIALPEICPGKRECKSHGKYKPLVLVLNFSSSIHDKSPNGGKNDPMTLTMSSSHPILKSSAHNSRSREALAGRLGVHIA